MNLKLRFAVLFTFFVALVLIISSASIYILYFNYRESDSYNHLRSDGYMIYKEFVLDKSDNKKFLSSDLSSICNDFFSNETLSIHDSSYHVLYKDPDSLSVELNASFAQNIRNAPKFEYRYSVGIRECIALYIPENKVYVLVSGIDTNGLNKLRTLKFILGTVFIAGFVITLLFSFLFVHQAFKPLVRLGEQIKRTTELNLFERISVGKKNNEVNHIARNFNAMLERLNQAFESEKSFVHHASHELRTPLASMLAQTESALRKDLSKEEYKKLLESLKEDQSGLIDLTNSLLLLSQYEKIQSSDKWPLIRVDEVLYDTISNIKKMLQGIDIDLQFTNVPDDENGLMIKGNEALLKVAFSNLIKNAWQYSTNKKIVVTIDASAEFINIHFDNQGSTLTESEIEKLKVPFFRGSNSKDIKGFGLGLSIVDRIIMLHHGNFKYSLADKNTNRFTTSFKVGA
ncbi:MAG: HAMP domain-containing histidine kinase [Bacteroidota bacterium]|nr:HAMP domain-containing histidine kinase [Bacteroidota bacterium]